MKSVLVSVILLGLTASSAFAQGPSGPTIATPSLVVPCQPFLLKWGGGSPPYRVSVLPSPLGSGPAVVAFPETNATELTWMVNQQPGTILVLSVADQTGGSNPSAPFTVQPGNTSCLTSATTSFSFGATVADASTPIISASSAAPIVGAAPTTPPSSTPTGNTGSSHASTTAAGAASTTPKSGASRVTGQVAAAGIVAAAIVALFG